MTQLDSGFFSVWGRDLFKNVDELNQALINSASANNWTIICKAFQSYLEKENYQDSYLDIRVELILEGDKAEFFGFFISFISVMLIKKKYLWNQSIGLVSNSDSYNYLKQLEANLSVTDSELDAKENQKTKDSDRDDNQTLVVMVTDLQKNLKQEVERCAEYKQKFEAKKEEADELKKNYDQKSFDFEKMKLRVDALEQQQKEYYDSMALQSEHAKLMEQIKRLEKREDDLELENSFLRDKNAELDRRNKELRELEAKYNAEENMKKRFDMVLERNEALIAEGRKKDLEIENLKYQVELLKKSKEALENALSNCKAENMRLEQQIVKLNEEIRARDQDINNLDKFITKLKDQIALNEMQSSISPMAKQRRNNELNFDKPEDENYLQSIEDELNKLRAEKALGWPGQTNLNKDDDQKELLNQEINRLNQKLKGAYKELEEYKKKEAEWNQKEAKYKTTCVNFKKTIGELKKELDNALANKEAAKNFEKLFGESQKVRKEFEEEVKVLYSIVGELTEENQILREDRGARRNKMVDYLEYNMKLFEERA